MKRGRTRPGWFEQKWLRILFWGWGLMHFDLLTSIPRHPKRIDHKLQTLSSKSVCLGSGSTVLGGGYWGAGAPHPPQTLYCTAAHQTSRFTLAREDSIPRHPKRIDPRGPCPGPGRIHVVDREKTLSSTDVPNPWTRRDPQRCV